MSDTQSLGKTRRPVSEAWDDPRYVVKAMLAASLGVALYSGALVGAWRFSIDLELPVFISLTLLFAVPLAVALFRMGRLGIVGALVLAGGITAAHFVAVLAAARIYEPGPLLFATAAQLAADAAREQLSSFKTGAVGGAVGAALSFAFIATLAPGLRDRRRLGDYALATLMLASLSAVVLGALSVRGETVMPQEMALLLYVPWQSAFAFAIVGAFKDHKAARFVRAAG